MVLWSVGVLELLDDGVVLLLVVHEEDEGSIAGGLFLSPIQLEFQNTHPVFPVLALVQSVPQLLAGRYQCQ